jgi:type I restriction enzyme R subunit
MPRNEQQTRFELIDPMLLDHRGWSREDIRVEETAAPVDIVYGKGRRRPKGRTDYVLRRPLKPGTEPIPLAILEAKHEGLPPGHGLQQGKGYLVGHLHHVPFVFSSNGHQFVEYDEHTGITSDLRPMSEFPTPDELVTRLLAVTALPVENKDWSLLLTPYAKGRDYLRYYQDAAIRATMEKTIRQRAAGELPRVLLSLATGSGKTRVAAVLLRRMFDAGVMGRALFVCDRTELRDNGLGDFQAVFGNDAAEVDSRHPQKNARVLVATYQTLAQDMGPDGLAFFQAHYPADFFDVIVIDECHRSAWGDWRAILDQHKTAVQIGLTATPREIRIPKVAEIETRAQVEIDTRFLADNYNYFGDPAYEYTYLQGVADGYLAPNAIETYDLFQDGRREPERVRGVKREDVAAKKLTDLLSGEPVHPEDVYLQNAPSTLESRLFEPERIKTMCAHYFVRLLANGENDPLQKSIIFCASDHHADLVANELNNLYAKWCRANGQRRVATYAFKCMSSVNGQSLIPSFRGRKRSHIVATTKDLLTTGVNVPCVRNIVFFRYVQSPILFYQMIGRGTRIDEETGKLMFRIFDYTGATTLFGADLITPPPPEPRPPGPPLPPPPAPIKVKGVVIDIRDTGIFNVMSVDGRLTRVTPDEYRARLVQELTANVPSLADFRARWLQPEARAAMLAELAERQLLPEKLREGANMDAYDIFDVLAALAYGITPRTRAERAAQFSDTGPDWLLHLPPLSVKVLRAIVRQFERAGTDGLETNELWQTPDIRRLNGLKALREGGDPAELLRKLKETLFAA